tara:strand:- start:1273 stop:1713 length:441 start_codon:yes stop_codon:yes gene_type:complete
MIFQVLEIEVLMKKFRETKSKLYESSELKKYQEDLALISEKKDICDISIDDLRSKVMRDRHKKLCKGKKHWSTTKKKAKKDSIWSKDAHRHAKSGGHKLHNSLEEADLQNLIVHIQDITKDMIKALKRNDQRTVNGLYKNLGKVIK